MRRPINRVVAGAAAAALALALAACGATASSSSAPAKSGGSTPAKGCAKKPSGTLTEVKLQLQWSNQAQFA
ncbi:MAG: hypothetical protein J2O46_10685, partial [Nocardioides sp.]|nr:hypothetical protein [Nocardioides sp.]